MKYNALLLLCGLLIFTGLHAQDLYLEAETEIKGSALMALAGKSSTKMYIKNDHTKSETRALGSTIVEITQKDTVCVYTDGLCGVFTREELENDGLGDEITYKNVIVTHTDDTRKILGYNCKKTVVNYTVHRGVDLKCETVLWHTSEISPPDNSHLPQSQKQNDYLAALKSLKGVPLLTENTMKLNGLTTIARVTKISTAALDDEVFERNPKGCKKPKNLSEYKKELKKREARSNSPYRGF